MLQPIYFLFSFESLTGAESLLVLCGIAFAHQFMLQTASTGWYSGFWSVAAWRKDWEGALQYISLCRKALRMAVVLFETGRGYDDVYHQSSRLQQVLCSRVCGITKQLWLLLRP